MNEYITQAKEFLKETNATLSIEFLKRGFHFEGDKEERDIYKCTLKKGTRSYTFNLGDSIANTYGETGYLKSVIEKFNLIPGMNRADIQKNKRYGDGFHLTLNDYHNLVIILNKTPNEYDVIACLNVDYCESFQDFCDCFGYDVDSIEAEKTYKAVMKEQEGLMRLFSDDEIEKLNEIN